jgi:2-methylisocitrate lyase-like PEP mutase family enzyme
MVLANLWAQPTQTRFKKGKDMSQQSAGAAFRQAVQEEHPLQVIGAINANHALLAKRAGYRAIYLSGGGVAAGSLGLPTCHCSSTSTRASVRRRSTSRVRCAR